MKKFLTLSFIVLLTMQTTGQIYTDIKQLKEAGIDINQYPPRDLLNIGIGNCDLAIIKSAIAKGADVNFHSEGAGTSSVPLCSAIAAAGGVMMPAEYSMIVSMIRDQGPKVYSGRSVSDLRRDYIEIIRFLLQNGAKTTIPPDSPLEIIPLLLAAKYRDLEIVRLLLDFKADPNSRDGMGNTALHVLGQPVAVPYLYKNAPEIAKLLISKGVKISPDILESTKSSLNIIQSEVASYWRDLPFYNELVNSLKSLIEIYSK